MLCMACYVSEAKKVRLKWLRSDLQHFIEVLIAEQIFTLPDAMELLADVTGVW